MGVQEPPPSELQLKPCLAFAWHFGLGEPEVGKRILSLSLCWDAHHKDPCVMLRRDRTC